MYNGIGLSDISTSRIHIAVMALSCTTTIELIDQSIWNR